MPALAKACAPTGAALECLELIWPSGLHSFYVTHDTECLIFLLLRLLDRARWLSDVLVNKYPNWLVFLPRYANAAPGQKSVAIRLIYSRTVPSWVIARPK